MEQVPIDLVFFFGGGWASANFLQRGKGESYGGGGRRREALDFLISVLQGPDYLL